LKTRRSHPRLARASAALALAVALGCATTEVTSQSASYERAPRPDRILVHAFATTPDEVRLDHSVTATAAWKMHGVPEAAERREVARAVSDALADQLVKKLSALGFATQRSDGIPAPDDGVTLVIDGQFLSIDEGSRTARVVIGLGAGRSEVRTAVQVYEWSGGARRVIEEFEIDAKSGGKPGMAETMGAGAAAGNLGQAAAMGAAGAAGSEAFGDDVEADAHRTAGEAAKVLETLFRRQGWLAGGSR
jgi:hypothetical protein